MKYRSMSCGDDCGLFEELKASLPEGLKISPVMRSSFPSPTNSEESAKDRKARTYRRISWKDFVLLSSCLRRVCLDELETFKRSVLDPRFESLAHPVSSRSTDSILSDESASGLLYPVDPLLIIIFRESKKVISSRPIPLTPFPACGPYHASCGAGSLMPSRGSPSGFDP